MHAGATPVYVAAQNGHLDVSEAVVKEGRADVNMQDTNGIAPVYVAAIEGNAEVRTNVG